MSVRLVWQAHWVNTIANMFKVFQSPGEVFIWHVVIFIMIIYWSRDFDQRQRSKCNDNKDKNMNTEGDGEWVVMFFLAI